MVAKCRFVLLAASLAMGPLGCGAPGAERDPDRDPAAEPLTVDAGTDRLVLVGEAVLLAGESAGGPEGAERLYLWTIGDSPEASEASLVAVDDATASFEPDVAGEYLLTLTVTAAEAEADDTLTVTAEPVPDLSPSLAAIADQHTRPGTMVEVPVLIEAPDPAAVGLTVTSSDETLLPEAAIEVVGTQGERWLRLTPVEQGFGVVEVTVVASDGEGRTAGRSFELVVARLLGVQQELPHDGLPPGPGNAFGAAVAISGSRAVVGAPFSDQAGTSAGVAHVYVRSAAGWSEAALLAPGQPPVEVGASLARSATGASVGRGVFGSGVGISGDTIVVGAPGDRGTEEPDPGRAYFYRRCNPFVTMCPQPYIEDAVLQGDTGERDRFGAAVDVDGAFAVIGAPRETVLGLESAGAAYVYELRETGWTRVARLVSSEVALRAGFGSAVAIGGDRIVVGAPWDDLALGAVYVYERAGASWHETARVIPSEEANYYSGSGFGSAVDIDGDRFVVGTPSLSSEEENGPGAVYELSGDTWQLAGLLHPTAGHRTYFGAGVAIHGDDVLVGAPRDWNAEDEVGSVTLFTRFDDGWRRVERIFPDDAAVWGEFGSAVAFEDGHAVVGAPMAGTVGAAFALGE